MESSRDERRFALVLALAHLAVVGYATYSHAMWRDEMEAWLIANHSSLRELYRDIKFTGHPSFWYLCLRVLGHVTNAPWIMQAFHATLAASAVYVLARWSPFNRLQKTLFAFGYFGVFEYAVISRDYGLAILLVTILCSLARARPNRPLSIAAVTALICHTNTHAMMVALPLGAGALWQGFRSEANAGTRLRWVAAVGWLAAGAGAAFWMAIPPSDASVRVAGWEDLLRRLSACFDWNKLFEATSALRNAFFPIPEFRPVFWESNWFDGSTFWYVSSTVAALVLASAAAALLPRRQRVVYLATIVTLLIFFLIVYPGYTRHQGFLFTAFWASLWFARARGDELSPRDRLLSRAFSIVLCFQFVGGMAALVLHSRAPFSQSREVARFLRAEGLTDLPIVADHDCGAMAVTGYLGRPLFYPRLGREGTYVTFDRAHRHEVDERKMLASADQHYAGWEKVILVLTYELSSRARTHYFVEKLASFRGAIAGGENFHVYALFPRS